MKAHATISIDTELLKEARERLMNISTIAEKAIRKAVTGSIDAPEEERHCFFCDSQEDLTFLCPDEKWICPKCLKTEVRRVPIAVAVRK